MNLEQTLEALDRAIKVMVLCGGKPGDATLRTRIKSLRDSLPQLLADAKAFRAMKERGPVSGAVLLSDGVSLVKRGDEQHWCQTRKAQRLYALPDTKEGGQ